MTEFLSFLSRLGAMPDWILLVCPALLIAAGLAFAVLRAEKVYLPVAVGLGGAELLFVCADLYALNENASSAEVYGFLLAAAACMGGYVILCAVVRLFFLIPFRKKKKDSRAQEMYEKFRVDLDDSEPSENTPASVLISEEESGLQLAHVFSMLEKLRSCELEPGDRLETDSIAHTIGTYQGRALTTDEMAVVTDCLAAVLKLTAKYKL